jgi:hypothetical protein
MQRRLAGRPIAPYHHLPGLNNVTPFDSDDRPLDDYEYPDEYDSDDDWDNTHVLPCPRCGAEIAEDSVRCPICGDYVTFGSRVWDGKSWWWILLGLLGIAATVLSLSLW